MRSSASALALAMLLASCAGTPRTRPGYAANPARATTYDEVGLATWYGEEAAGHPTASGQPFDPAGMTAAHRTLPLGSAAEITDLTTGRHVLVLVNDRGPRDRSRLIDLSRGAAQALGTDRHPMTRVRVRLVSVAPPPQGFQRLPVRERREAVSGGPALVQVAAFSNEPRARALAAALGGSVEPAGQSGARVWRVRLGPFTTRAEAERARDAAVARGYGDASVHDAN